MRDGGTTELSQDSRQKILAAALDLLKTGGREALTTRAAAAAAGFQAPTIYRHFGDKRGLLDAVADHGFRAYLQQKHIDVEGTDPVDNLRIGWDLHVGFGLANPAVFTAMYGDPEPDRASMASRRALEMLRARMHGLARAGRLRVDVGQAAAMVRAAACGVVFVLLETPEDARDIAVSHASREAVIAAITVDRVVSPHVGLAPLANMLRARLPETDALTDAERGLLSEWLGRIVQGGSTSPSPIAN